MSNFLLFLNPSVFIILIIILALLLYFFTKKFKAVDPNRTIAAWGEQVAKVATNHTQVAGMLAGFSITIVVLIIGFRLSGSMVEPNTFLEEAALSMFMMAFFGYVVTGVLYSIVPEREGTHQIFLFIVASLMYYFSVVLSFTALLPLVRLIGYESVQFVIIFMIIGSILGGYWVVAIPLYDLLKLRRSVLVLLFVFAALIAFSAQVLGDTLLNINKSALFLPVILPASSVLVSLVFFTCMPTFFFEGLVQENIFTKLSLLSIIIVTAVMIYLSSTTILFLKI